MITTVANAESSDPSFTLNVKPSDPVKPDFGVYTTFGTVPDSVPLAGKVTTVNFSVAPSGSLPVKTTDLLEPAATDVVWPSAVGA